MKRYEIMRMTPLDNTGVLEEEWNEFPGAEKLIRIGEKRTHKLALSMISPGVSLRRALAGAYIQGIRDAAQVLDQPTIDKEI